MPGRCETDQVQCYVRKTDKIERDDKLSLLYDDAASKLETKREE